MVLRAKIVAQSFTVDWLSNAPWVSIRTTATLKRKGKTEKIKMKKRRIQRIKVHSYLISYPIIPALEKLRQEDSHHVQDQSGLHKELEASMGYRMRYRLKKSKRKKILSNIYMSYPTPVCKFYQKNAIRCLARRQNLL